MKTAEFITERKKKRSKSKKLQRYFYPGYGYYGMSGSESDSAGGDGGGGESMYETSPALALAKELPSLKKHDYDTIDKLMQNVAKKYKISDKVLHNLFIKRFRSTPDDWIKNKLDEHNGVECDLQKEVEKFVEWAREKLKLKSDPKIILSMDTQQAQDGHHTGMHQEGSNKIWVYAKNRNLVDILRTVFHELVHVRQGEKGMIEPNSSYPGSPIEVMADALAGKYIKIYGKDNPHIFQ